MGRPVTGIALSFTSTNILGILYFFTPCIVIQLCNIYQRNEHFSNYYFNSILDVFYMFRNSWIHPQFESL